MVTLLNTSLHFQKKKKILVFTDGIYVILYFILHLKKKKDTLTIQIVEVHLFANFLHFYMGKEEN